MKSTAAPAKFALRKTIITRFNKPGTPTHFLTTSIVTSSSSSLFN